MFKLLRKSLGINVVVLSTLMVCAIEHYDFIVYGILSNTIGKVFFTHDGFFQSSDSGYVASLLSFLVFASAFMARPFGALFFGYIGDKKGRRVALNISTALLVFTVFGMAALPAPTMWGVWSPIALTILRILQGAAYGAELGGIVLMVESVDPSKVRVVWCMRIVVCAIGMIIGLLVVKACEALCTTDQMLTWGWRIPFLVAVIFSIPLPKLRNLICEGLEYSRYKESGKYENILKSLLQNIGAVFMTGAMASISAGFFYVGVVYIDIGRKSLFLEYEAATLLLLFMACINSVIKDLRKRRIYFIGVLLFIISVIYPLIQAIEHGSMFARVAYSGLAGTYLGFYGSFVTLLFPVGSRQTCFSMGYSIGYMFGALAPAGCLWFYHTTNVDIGPALYIMTMATVVLVMFSLFIRVEDGKYRFVVRKTKQMVSS